MAPTGKLGPLVAAAVTFALAALSPGPVVAQSGCMSVLISLAPCLNFVSGSSSVPSSSCCSQLASVVQTQPRCLCMVLNGGGASLGVTINQTQALALPGACNVQTPPVSLCNAGAGGPAMAPPVLAPAGSPQALPGNDDSPSSSSAAGGTSRATSSSSSKANSVAAFARFIILSLFITSWVSGLRAF